MLVAHLYHRQWLLIRLPILATALLVISFLWVVVWPIPPARLSITTAGAPGAYHSLGLQYAARFAAYGIELDVQTSEGSQQNIERLTAAQNPSDLAFMQGGFGYLGTSGERRESSRIETLANVDIEGAWLFTRGRSITSLLELKGLRVAVGPNGGGSRRVALKLFDQAKIDLTTVTLSGQVGPAAVDALNQGAVDAVFFVAPPESSTLKRLLGLPSAQLASLGKSAAIAERNPYLEPRLLTQGAFGNGLPLRDTTILTATASLVAREDLHPALKRMALAVSTEVHTGGGLFHKAGDFPSLRRIDFPSAAQARPVLSSGLPFLERTLSFWWAQFIQRLLLIALPVALLAWWLMQLLPGLLRWKLESHVSRWYGELKFIENELQSAQVPGMDLAQFLVRLNTIDAKLLSFRCPKELMPRCYVLRQHVDFVRQRLNKVRGR